MFNRAAGYGPVAGHMSLSGASVWSGDIIVLKRVWHQRTTLTDSSIPHEAPMCTPGTGGAGSPVPLQGWAVMISPNSHTGVAAGTRTFCEPFGGGILK